MQAFFKSKTEKKNSLEVRMDSYCLCCHLSKQYGDRQTWQQSKEKHVVQAFAYHDPYEQRRSLFPWSATWRRSRVSQPRCLGSSRCAGTSTGSWENRGWLMATRMQWQIVPPRCQDMTSGDREEGLLSLYSQGCGLGGEGSSWCCWNTTEHFVHVFPLYRTVFDFLTLGKIYVANSW